ncbi:MAG TPA: glycosyltransferase [Tepidisphaeraceae bacterium]|jgi:GT2 family glycosyltransferase
MSNIDLPTPVFTKKLPLHTSISQPRIVRAPHTLAEPIRVSGKFFREGSEKWFLKGFTYGPFAPNREGNFLPERHRMLADFQHMKAMGANAVRLYHIPPRALLDDALENGLRVLIDVPWEKHRCFFEDWHAQEGARNKVRETARSLGDHPAVLAISVANELPKDVVRFYGHRRVEKFLDDLLDIVKQEAPNCLATYTNYPSTEFLNPSRLDFYSFNVYLHDTHKLGAYLDRLQHIAGARPLILGEYGVDSMRNGETNQTIELVENVQRVFRHGLAGSFVFSYTDDWFTGGHQIADWAFGVTNRERQEKPAAAGLRKTWASVPGSQKHAHPKVSVVVCSYNGAATLEECLHSLGKLNYPNYEVVLVDDGSTDNSHAIAARFPAVRYIYQQNKGLSVARNVGAEAARGEIVAYTDSDCVVDEDWLLYLVDAMLEQKVDAIGGPNVPPASDSWTAKCVAASPGGPSHVMLDDRRAEHVPGCNMAFRRSKLLALGGFDARFRQAGDDVDICWRFMDAGMEIGYAPAALVWHHRRTSAKAYLMQQKGYGRSEAMLAFKHPQRFNTLGCSLWRGVIYGEGAVGLPLIDPVIYHGRHGSALFQTKHRGNQYSAWAYFTLLEWHGLALFILSLSLLCKPLALVSAAMWALTLVAAIRSAATAPLPRTAPWWCRPAIFGLYLAQPMVRAWHRYWYRLSHKNLPAHVAHDHLIKANLKRISHKHHDLYWNSTEYRGRDELLAALLAKAQLAGWAGDFEGGWTNWDVMLVGDLWNDITIHTATEELGWPKRFTRARCSVHATAFAKVMIGAAIVWTAVAAVTMQLWPAVAALAVTGVLVAAKRASERRCLKAVTRLVWRAGRKAKLQSVTVSHVPARADAKLDAAKAGVAEELELIQA